MIQYKRKMAVWPHQATIFVQKLHPFLQCKMYIACHVTSPAMPSFAVSTSYPVTTWFTCKTQIFHSDVLTFLGIPSGKPITHRGKAAILLKLDTNKFNYLPPWRLFWRWDWRCKREAFSSIFYTVGIWTRTEEFIKIARDRILDLYARDRCWGSCP